MRESQVESSALLSAGDICEDIQSCEAESVERNREGKYFQHMIHKIQSELQEVVSESSSHDNNRCVLWTTESIDTPSTAVGFSERSFWTCSV